MAAAVSLHLDALVCDLHVCQLQKTGHVRLKWLRLTPEARLGGQSDGLTSVLRPLKGMLVSHIATR